MSSILITTLHGRGNLPLQIRFAVGAISLFPALVFLILQGCSNPSKSSGNGELVDVGIYAGSGTQPESVKACFAAVRASGYTCDTLRMEEIIGSSIGRFASILFPAGDAHFYSELAGPVGRGYLRRYVADGGGYIGVGAGGAFAVADSGNWPGFGLINGTSRYPSDRIVPNPYYGMVEISRGASPGFAAIAPNYQTLYLGGPEFFPTNSNEITVDYVYSSTGSAAIIGGKYGFGHFWVAGIQPEIEEGNARDETTFGDNFVDPDSEWELIQAALDMCVTYANRLE